MMHRASYKKDNIIIVSTKYKNPKKKSKKLSFNSFFWLGSVHGGPNCQRIRLESR